MHLIALVLYACCPESICKSLDCSEMLLAVLFSEVVYNEFLPRWDLGHEAETLPYVAPKTIKTIHGTVSHEWCKLEKWFWFMVHKIMHEIDCNNHVRKYAQIKRKVIHESYGTLLLVNRSCSSCICVSVHIRHFMHSVSVSMDLLNNSKRLPIGNAFLCYEQKYIYIYIHIYKYIWIRTVITPVSILYIYIHIYIYI